jgi:hypothetical protein
MDPEALMANELLEEVITKGYQIGGLERRF